MPFMPPMTQLSTKSNRFKSGTMGRAILALSSCFWAFGTFYSHADETIPTGMTLSDYSFWMAMQDEKSQKQDIITSSLPSQGGRQAIEVDLYGLTDGAVYLEADSIITYESGLVSASGSVQMRHKTRLIRADNVDFNTDTGEVSAHGNTQTINDDGSVQYADKIFFNDPQTLSIICGFTAITAISNFSPEEVRDDKSLCQLTDRWSEASK
jgi:hypothetical protein